jgi:hypothetical protein
LNCGHCSSVSEDKLPYFGLHPDASLVTLTKRFDRQEKQKQSRDLGPPLVPND